MDFWRFFKESACRGLDSNGSVLLVPTIVGRILIRRFVGSFGFSIGSFRGEFDV